MIPPLAYIPFLYREIFKTYEEYAAFEKAKAQAELVAQEAAHESRKAPHLETEADKRAAEEQEGIDDEFANEDETDEEIQGVKPGGTEDHVNAGVYLSNLPTYFV